MVDLVSYFNQQKLIDIGAFNDLLKIDKFIAELSDDEENSNPSAEMAIDNNLSNNSAKALLSTGDGKQKK